MLRGLVSDDSKTRILKKHTNKNIQGGDITDHPIPCWCLKVNEALGKEIKIRKKIYTFLFLF